MSRPRQRRVRKAAALERAPWRRRADAQWLDIGFVVAGAQKAGTSTLFAGLRAHPEVATEKGFKEWHFFDVETQDWADPDYSEYRCALSPDSTERIAGDATPEYFYYPDAMRRMARYNSAMRIVVSLRDPLERAFSHYLMTRRRRPRMVADFASSCHRTGVTRLTPDAKDMGGIAMSFVARGLYAQIAEETLTHFPADQVLFCDYHRIFGDFAGTMARLAAHLGLSPFEEPPESRHLLAAPRVNIPRPVTGEDLRGLADYFADDLARLHDVTGVDPSAWPTTGILAGRTDPEDLAARLNSRVGVGAQPLPGEDGPPAPRRSPTAKGSRVSRGNT